MKKSIIILAVIVALVFCTSCISKEKFPDDTAFPTVEDTENLIIIDTSGDVTSGDTAETDGDNSPGSTATESSITDTETPQITTEFWTKYY